MAKERDDRELVRLTVAGDREAYRELFERYQARVFALTHDVLRSREDAQDVTQEAFVKAYQSLSDFKGDSAFYTWLYRIAYNLAIDAKRRTNRRGGPTAEFEESQHEAADGLVAAIEGPHTALYHKQQRGLIRRALEALSDEHRAVVVLREVDGLSYEEIAKITGASLGTVMSRLFYARKKLQRALKDVAPGDGTGQDAEGPGDAVVKNVADRVHSRSRDNPYKERPPKQGPPQQGPPTAGGSGGGLVGQRGRAVRMAVAETAPPAGASRPEGRQSGSRARIGLRILNFVSGLGVEVARAKKYS